MLTVDNFRNLRRISLSGKKRGTEIFLSFTKKDYKNTYLNSGCSKKINLKKFRGQKKKQNKTKNKGLGPASTNCIRGRRITSFAMKRVYSFYGISNIQVIFPLVQEM